ncbi:hypothetical protein AAE478_005012 [Parahypoxylon ruwenzoriense]
MADEDLLRRIHGLGDLDLAALLCLISREHCIVSTEPSEIDSLIAELRLVASHTFGLPSAVVDCAPHTTLDDFVSSIQIQPPHPLTTPSTPGAAKAGAHSSPEYPLQRRGTNSSRFRGAHQQQQQQPQHAHHRQNSRSSNTHGNNASTSTNTYHHHHHHQTATTPPQIANVILAKNLDHAPRTVQIQCLELLRTRRILTRTSVQTAPKQFLFIAVLGAGEDSPDDAPRANTSTGLVNHLNDFFYVAHWHDPEDGFAHLEEQEEEEERLGRGREAEYASDEGNTGDREGDEASTDNDTDSASSVVVRRSVAELSILTTTATLHTNRSRSDTADTYKPANPPSFSSPLSSFAPSPTPLLPEASLVLLSQRAQCVTTDIDVQRYQHNIVSFLRLHRAVFPASASSATPRATRHLAQLSSCLAAVHGQDYITPSLVALAARKVYPHRLRLVNGAGFGGADRFARQQGREEGSAAAAAAAGRACIERERSMQWGSDRAAVEVLLEGVTPEDVIEDVLAMVAAPL